MSTSVKWDSYHPMRLVAGLTEKTHTTGRAVCCELNPGGFLIVDLKQHYRNGGAPGGEGLGCSPPHSPRQLPITCTRHTHSAHPHRQQCLQQDRPTGWCRGSARPAGSTGHCRRPGARRLHPPPSHLTETSSQACRGPFPSLGPKTRGASARADFTPPEVSVMCARGAGGRSRFLWFVALLLQRTRGLQVPPSISGTVGGRQRSG